MKTKDPSEAVLELEDKPEAYLLNDYEDAAIRWVTENGIRQYFRKFKGKKEFPTERSNRIVFDAILGMEEIEKSAYDSF